MGSRIAMLLERDVEGGLGEQLFTFESGDRRYRVPINTELKPRNPHARARKLVGLHGEIGSADARVSFKDGGRKSLLASLAVDYDLTSYQLDGEAPLTFPRPQRVLDAATATPREIVEAAIEAHPDPVTVVHAATTPVGTPHEGRWGDCDECDLEVATEVTAVEVERFMGWPLVLVPKKPEPLIEDAELGRRLGYTETRAVRKLIARMAKAKQLGELVRDKTSRTSPLGGAPTRPLLLTRTQALKVIARSSTVVADAILNEIIAVYQAWSSRKLAPAAPLALAPADLDRALAPFGDRLTQIEQRLAEGPTVAQMRDVTAPGHSAQVAGVHVIAPPRPESMSMRNAAGRVGLPYDRAGRRAFAIIAQALGLDENANATCAGTYPTSSGRMEPHRRYLPLALELVRPAARAYAACLGGLGYGVINGLIVTTSPAARVSTASAAARAIEAALAQVKGAAPVQTTLPKVG